MTNDKPPPPPPLVITWHPLADRWDMSDMNDSRSWSGQNDRWPNAAANAKKNWSAAATAAAIGLLGWLTDLSAHSICSTITGEWTARQQHRGRQVMNKWQLQRCCRLSYSITHRPLPPFCLLLLPRLHFPPPSPPRHMGNDRIGSMGGWKSNYLVGRNMYYALTYHLSICQAKKCLLSRKKWAEDKTTCYYYILFIIIM